LSFRVVSCGTYFEALISEAIAILVNSVVKVKD
jgi:hypothetical protein